MGVNDVSVLCDQLEALAIRPIVSSLIVESKYRDLGDSVVLVANDLSKE